VAQPPKPVIAIPAAAPAIILRLETCIHSSDFGRISFAFGTKTKWLAETRSSFLKKIYRF
jgi:hypothetical protein